MKNPFSRGGSGAGFGVAKMPADRGIDLVVAGEFGPKMIGALEKRGLRALEAAGTVREGLAAACV